MKAPLLRFLSTIVLGFSLPSASAVEVQVLTTPFGINYWVGFDGFVDTADDIVFPAYPTAPGGLNPLGSTGSTLNTDPTDFFLPADGAVVGFFTGSTTIGSVLGDQLIIGTNEIAAGSFDQLVNFFADGASLTPALDPVSGAPLLNVPFSGTLNTSAPATLQLNADNSFTTSALYDYGGGVFSFDTTFGRYLAAGQDPNVVFAGEASTRDFFNGLLPILPAGWTMVSTDFFFFDSVSAPGTGSANGSTVYISFDPGAIPAVVPVPAALPLLGAGLLSLLTLRRRH